jgi:hypothetical protein
MNDRVLQRENVELCGTGGVSQENAATGFRPAFFDCESRTIYPSRIADGTPAPIHLPDGLPARGSGRQDRQRTCCDGEAQHLAAKIQRP